MGFIATQDNFMDMIVMIANDELDICDVSFSDNLCIKIKIQGEKWNGKVNYIIAKYIIKLQKDIINTHNKIFQDDIISLRDIKSIDKRLLVSVNIDEGCTGLIIWLAKFFESQFEKATSQAINKMSGKEIAFTVTIIAALLFGPDFVLNYYQVKTNAEIKKSELEIEKLERINDQKIKEKLIEITDKSIEIVRENTESIKYLHRSLDDSDTITSVNHDITINGADSKKYNKEQDAEKLSQYIDGEYKITSMTITSNTAAIISSDNIKFTASTELLSDNDKETLHDIFKKAHILNTEAVAKLHVVAKMKDGVPQGYSITALDETPRKGSIAISKLVPSKKTRKTPADMPLSKFMPGAE